MKTTNVRLSLPLSAPRWWARMEKLLGALYQLYEREPARPAAPLPDTWHLQNRQVIRLNKASNASRLHVRRGAVWLTRTPADADVILRAGDKLDLEHGWPIIVQALQDSCVDLVH
ncbi:MAG: DUF2917 domain-containing protein [Prosthecobacter sp.]